MGETTQREIDGASSHMPYIIYANVWDRFGENYRPLLFFV